MAWMGIQTPTRKEAELDYLLNAVSKQTIVLVGIYNV